MAAFKNKDNGTWYVQFRYTDWRGERKQKLKRGFATKREAQAWEREFLMQKQADINMTFESFVTLYEKDVKPKLKLNTWLTKESIIQKKILPYFKKRKLSEITVKDVIDWQNEIRTLTDSKGKPYSTTYLKTVHNQLSAIFNHAIRYYGLQVNPAQRAGNMGSEEQREMLFWTKEEYLKFADAMMDKPLSYYAFEMLYWCGIREGELLALIPSDFDFAVGTVRISKSYQRLKGQDVITTPKSNRVIQMPQFLCEKIQDYEIIGRMKQFADKKGVCVLLVHHTRKQLAGDKFEMISGTNGLLGCADGAFLLQKEKRTDLSATLDIVGRDQPDQRLHLIRDPERLIWLLDHAETELWESPPDPLLDKIAAVITADNPEWNGSATELVCLLQVDIQPNILTRKLNVKAGELRNEYQIDYSIKRTRNGSAICLARKIV